jgi:hypothetical protein
MTDQPFYLARATVHKIRGVHRRAVLADGTTLDMGVHGAIKEHFGLTDEPDLPLPVDVVVAATGT